MSRSSAEQFLAHLLSRNIRMEADLVDHLFNSSEKRLARLLMMMANFGQDSKPIPVIAKISQETLAEMIGTTRSRVSFFLNRFRDLGYIDYNGGGMQSIVHWSASCYTTNRTARKVVARSNTQPLLAQIRSFFLTAEIARSTKGEPPSPGTRPYADA